MKETEGLLAQAREALKRVEMERDETKAVLRAREREEMADYQDEIDRLRGTIRALTAKGRTRTASSQAGPKAMGAVREVLAEGELPQAEITRRTGLNNGTISYALRALMESGEIEPTGKRVESSRVFRLIPARKRRAA